ncbi:MAG TPA: hypothetical protein VES38_01315 [Methylotenera sp.]|nr:hypothetical protein [Methylotenera sp.]
MLNKIINILFVVVMTVTPVLTMASANTVSEVKNTGLAIEKSVFKTHTEIQVAKVELEAVRPINPKVADKTQTSAPINGWLLLSALFGFVLLCNRWTV